VAITAVEVGLTVGVVEGFRSYGPGAILLPIAVSTVLGILPQTLSVFVSLLNYAEMRAKVMPTTTGSLLGSL
jgi:hypothetical protein